MTATGAPAQNVYTTLASSSSLASEPELPKSAAVKYELKSIQAPVAQGSIMLSALHFLINSLGWTGLAWKLFDDSNMFLLRNSAKKIKGLDLVHLQPTFQPIPLKYFTTNQQGSAPAAKPPYPPPSSETGDGSRSTGFHFMTSAEYHSAYKSKRFSPLQVAEKMLEAIETSNKTTPPLLAVIKTDRQDVLRQARESTDRYAAGKPLSPLDGVPIVVKDEMDCLPYTTSLGTKFLDIKPERDAYCVARMKAAGCIVLGKANMHEIGIDVTNCNPSSGTPRNPYNLNHFTGGSSGGSAGAVGSGLVPIALGADGGGSIRIPASFCGVYGLKTTAHRINSQGSFPLGLTVGVVGPIAASAHDLAVAYAAMAGPNPDDDISKYQPVLPPQLKDFTKIRDLTGLRIGVYHIYFNDADPEIVDTCHSFIDKLKQRGAQVVDIEIPYLEEMRVAHITTIVSEMLTGTAAMPRSKFSLPTRISLSVAEQNLKPSDYLLASKWKTLGCNIMDDIFTHKCDLIVTPTNARTSPAIPTASLRAGISDLTNAGKTMRFIFLSNFLGIPGVSVPCGYDKDGLPIGFQFMAKWWNEELLLRMAAVSEDIFKNDRIAPKVYHAPRA